MRNKGESSVKFVGKSCDSARQPQGFHRCHRKSIVRPILLTSPPDQLTCTASSGIGSWMPFSTFFHKWGTSALAVSTAVPPPMPTSMLFAAAGACDYGVGRFLTVVMICRSVRYTLIANRRRSLWTPFRPFSAHPSQYWGWLLLFAAVIFSLMMAGILLNRRLTAATTA
jgi:hypothetical protein